MSATYRAIQLQGKGDLDQLKEVELPVTAPGPGELRVRVRASGVGATDLSKRRGYYPYRPPFPFVEGYEVVGEVDAIGPGVTGFSPGQRVCALTVYGAWAELMVRGAEHFVPVPDGLDDAAVVALILNYVTAYQMIHRTAALSPGQTALVTGANGGVGVALLELLRAHGVRALGAASPRHAALIESLGATRIDSRGRPLDELVHALIPGGVDAAFDGLGGAGTRECIRATRRGGAVVGYGFVATFKHGRPSTLASLRGFASLFLGGFLRGRRPRFYGITQIYRKDRRPFQEDLPKLFALLAEGKIRPPIAARLPLLAGKEAERMLEAGGVAGKIVLLRDLH